MSASAALVLLVFGVSACATQAVGPRPDGAMEVAAPPQAEPEAPMAESPLDLLHEPSGMRFPVAVSGLTREKMSRFDRRGHDVSVAYVRSEGDIALASTVYIFPGERYGGDLEGHFGEARDAVMRNRRGAELIGEGQMRLWQRGGYQVGLRAHFLIRDPSGERPVVVSHLFLFKHGPWFIKYRATFPADQHERGDDMLLAFMAALPWPELGPAVLAGR